MPDHSIRSNLSSSARGARALGRHSSLRASPLYHLAERLERQGVKLQRIPGPWRPARCTLRRPGRNAERSIPIVTNGVVEIAVDTAEHAVNLSGFLNSAGLDHLDPIPNLRPPEKDVIRD